LTFFRHPSEHPHPDADDTQGGHKPLSFAGFGELGAYLLAERERQEISRSEIASRTKISMDQLVNLESGTFTGLAPVYARGFLRSYAMAVNIDPAVIVSEYKRLSGPADKTDPRKPLVTKYDPIDLDADEGVSFGTAFLVLLAAIAILAVLTAFNRTVHNLAAEYIPFLAHWPEAPTASAAPAQTAPPGNVAPDTARAQPAQPIPPAGEASGRPAAPGRETLSLAAPPSGPEPAPAASGGGAPPAPSGPALLPASSPGPEPPAPGGTLRLKALRATWAQVSVDNGPVIHVYFKAGEERSFDSKDSITLAAGNGAAVEAEWNGASLGPLGPEGPLELNFPPPRT
jgi:cytoskeletal protein RodZ